MTHNYSAGLLASEVDQCNYSVAYTYDANRNVLTRQDKRGKIWRYTYDARSNVLTAKTPLLETTTFAYSPTYNLPLTITDPLGNVTTYSYDAEGNLTSIEDALNRVQVQVQHDVFGQPIVLTNGLSHQTQIEYDLHGNSIEYRDPDNNVTTFEYDVLGRPVSTMDPLLRSHDIEYDEWGRQIKLTFPDGTFSTSTYSLENHKLTSTNPKGHTIATTYDDGGRLIAFTDALNRTLSFEYTPMGWLKKMIAPNGGVTNIYYNDRGDATLTVDPDGVERSRIFNGNGAITGRYNELNQTILYNYDDAGRLVLIDYPAGTDTSFEFDELGRRVLMIDTLGETTWTYNAVHNLTSVTKPNELLEFEYDDLNRMTAATVSGYGQIEITYSNRSQLSSFKNPFNEVTNFSFDAAGQLISKSFHNGVVTSYGYDERGRVATIVHEDTNENIFGGESVVWDEASRPVSRTVGALSTSYQFNAAGQLLSENSSLRSLSLSYDSHGRCISRTIGASTESLTHSVGGRLLNLGTTSFSYDLAGRRTGKLSSSGQTIYDYDFDNRLTQVTLPSQQTVSYSYNGLGSRVGRNGNNFKRSGVDAGSSLLGDSTATYTPGTSERRSGNSFFYHFDTFGDLAFLSDASGTTFETFNFGMFLDPIARTGATPTPIGADGGSGGYTDLSTGYIDYGGGSSVEPGLNPWDASLIRDEASGGDVDWEQVEEIAHIVLDIIGACDPTPITDGIHTIWYLGKGDYASAGLTAIGMIPYVGDIAKLGKYGKLVDGNLLGKIEDLISKVGWGSDSHHIIPRAIVKQLFERNAWFDEVAFKEFMRMGGPNVVKIDRWYHIGIHAGWFGPKYNSRCFALIGESGGIRNISMEKLQEVMQRLIDEYNL